MYYLEDNQKVENVNAQSIKKHSSTIVRGPFKPYMETDKLIGANQESYYWALLEVELLPNGCASVFSEPIRVRTAIPPESPSLDIEVLGVDERLELEFKVCEMLQQRDRFVCPFYCAVLNHTHISLEYPFFTTVPRKKWNYCLMASNPVFNVRVFCLHIQQSCWYPYVDLLVYIKKS